MLLQKIGGLNMGTIIIYILLVIGLIISTIASEETCKKRKKEILNFKDWLQTKNNDELFSILLIVLLPSAPTYGIDEKFESNKTS